MRYGIGLVPFSVDVHASQWGTITRLIHAVRTGAVSDGWAIDEDTALEVTRGEVTAVHGLGSAYHVTPDGQNGVRVTVRSAGTTSSAPHRKQADRRNHAAARESQAGFISRPAPLT